MREKQGSGNLNILPKKGRSPLISIIIPTWNSWHTLKHCLNAIQNQDSINFLYEVIIVDDGSCDGTGEKIKAASYPFPLFYFFQKNQGPAAARNLGILRAKGEIVLFLDADIIPAAGLIKEHLLLHLENRKVFVTGRVIPHSKASFYGRLLTNWLISPISRQKIRKNFSFPACNFSVKKKHLESVSGFNELFSPYGFEDTELGFRLCEKEKLRLIFSEKAAVYHLNKDNFQTCIQKGWHLGKNLIRFIRLHPEIFYEQKWSGYKKIYERNLLDILHFSPLSDQEKRLFLEKIKSLEEKIKTSDINASKKLKHLFHQGLGYSVFEGGHTELFRLKNRTPHLLTAKSIPKNSF